ncbi:MAG: hypothetical protein JW869_05120 [Candidatus Omnitrophica bacterium]|nr:hypothetical protein [Candidatus Omnitrophota bacterium]
MNSSVRLKIAQVVIEMRSRFAVEQLSKREKRRQYIRRFSNFIYKGEKAPDITIEVDVVKKLPRIAGARQLFTTYHFADGSENWRLLKKADTYVYKCPLWNKKQLMLVNNSFDKVHAYLLAKKNNGRSWNIGDIIYDFLQLHLINYFAQRKSGIFTHSIGVRDIDGQGFIFAGKSGCGKTTIARIWHAHSRASVLNDDRMIIRRKNGKFMIYASPWHGDFGDYLESRIEPAILEKMFFIYHAPSHRAKEVLAQERFIRLYPAVFPTFWDSKLLINIVSFCQDLLKKTPCYRLGFAKEKSVIDFIRKI